MPSPIEHLQPESPQDVPGKKLDRPYKCLSCHSYFKLKWHLDSHIKICSTKRPSKFECEKCHKKFVNNNKSRKFHEKTCKGKKEYKCADCDLVFSTIQQNIVHKRKQHTTEECDFCDKKIKQGQNMRRHIKLIHPKLTPRSAKLLELLKLQEKEDTCIAMQEKEMDEEDPDENLVQLGDEEVEHDFDEIETNEDNPEVNLIQLGNEDVEHDFNEILFEPEEGQTKSKKKVSWKKNLTTIVEIERKIKISKKMEEDIFSMLDVFKKFLPMQMSRRRFVELDMIKRNYERLSNKKFNEITFQTLVSLEKSSFQPVSLDDEIYVDISDIHIIEDIMKTKINQLYDDHVPYIDLAPLRERKRYQSAQDILSKNVYKFSDDEIDDVAEEADDKNLPIMERLLKKIERRNKKKRMRAMKIQAKMPNWQMDRLPKLARIINKIFVSQQKNLIKTEDLLERISNSEYRSMNIVADLNKLVETTDGWLAKIDGLLKRKPEDMNYIMYLIINH